MGEQKEQLHVVMAVFTREDQASEAFERVKSWQKEHYIDLEDIAIVSRGADRKVTVRDVADPGSGKGAKVGLLVGGVVGLIFPPSIIAGAAVGAATGTVYGHFRDKGLENKKLRQEGERLEPGQSAVIAVTGDRFVDDVVLGLKGLGEVGEYFLDIDSGAVTEVKK
jgi:uncharacterized membrane protein